MPNAISSVRITPSAFHLLNRLSGKLQRPKSQLIEEALEILEEHVFWQELQEAFASGEPEEMRAERAVGFGNERWPRWRPLVVRRGEILWCDLEPRRGHEQGEVRPVIVVTMRPGRR